MLHEPIRQHQRADGQVLEAARHADVHHEVGVVQVDEQLGGHGGVDLAYAAAAGDDVLADTVERYPRLFLEQRRLLRQHTFDLALHGVQQSDAHVGVLLKITLVYIEIRFVKGVF